MSTFDHFMIKDKYTQYIYNAAKFGLYVYMCICVCVAVFVGFVILNRKPRIDWNFSAT